VDQQSFGGPLRRQGLTVRGGDDRLAIEGYFRQQYGERSGREPGVRDQHRLARAGSAPGRDVAQGGVPQLCGSCDDLCELFVGVFVDLRDGRAGEDVVELVEEQDLPEASEFLGRVLGAVEGRRGREGLGLEQPVLALAVELLDLALAGERTPVKLQVEFAHPLREVSRKVPEVLVHAGHAQARQGGKVLRRA
jgi:hypothetical protein